MSNPAAALTGGQSSIPSLDFQTTATSKSGDINAVMNAPFTVGGAANNKFNPNTAIIAGTSLVGVFLWLKFGVK